MRSSRAAHRQPRPTARAARRRRRRRRRRGATMTTKGPTVRSSERGLRRAT
jgi:hypothetical protein